MAQSPTPSPARTGKPKKRKRADIEKRLKRAAENTSIYSNLFRDVNVRLITPEAQKLVDKFIKGTVDGLYRIGVVLPKIGKDRELILQLSDDISVQSKELLNLTGEKLAEAKGLVASTKAPPLKGTYPVELNFKATTHMAEKFLASVQNFDDLVSAMNSVVWTGEKSQTEADEFYNDVSGKIARFSISVMEKARLIDKIAQKIEGVDTSLLVDAPEQPAAPAAAPRASRARASRGVDGVTDQAAE